MSIKDPNYKRAPNGTAKMWCAYIENGKRPSSFGCALLTNDLSNACLLARQSDRPLLYRHFLWLQKNMSPTIWGSPAKVIRHIAMRQKCKERAIQEEFVR